MCHIHSLLNIFIPNSALVCLGMAPSPEMNNKMNNKVDGSGTPKPESKSKVTCWLCRMNNIYKNITTITKTVCQTEKL